MLFVATAAFVALTGLPSAPSAIETTISQRPVLGGYRTVEVDNEDVQTAARTAAESVDAEVAEITSAERQTVAGANYKISFTTTDGRQYQAVVFYGLDRSWRVTSIDETGDTGSNEADTVADSD